MDNTFKFSRQQRIVNTLLLNASFIDNLGLMHGKIGIAIYFFKLAQQIDNSVYEEYASELVDEIYDEIYAKTPCNFENGLAGIGYGIEYLVQNKLIDADTNSVLEEFDNQIKKEIFFHPPIDIGILDGIGGYIVYLYSRLYCNKSNAHIKYLKDSFKKAFTVFSQLINEQYINNSCAHVPEPEIFDLAWNYSSTIWLLSKFIELQICKDEAEKLLNQLLLPFVNKDLLPNLLSHRLLLALVIEELKHVKTHELPDINYNKLIKKLLNNVNHGQILIELADNSAFLQNGTSGIAFIYQKLFVLTKNPAYNLEYKYWINLTFKLAESYQGYAGFFMEKEKDETAYGILNGITGINIVS